jgi:hypothetical protein
MFYVGQTRSASLIERLNQLEVGECCVRGEYPPRRLPWFYDNGAFRDWKANENFNITRFMRDMRRITVDIEFKRIYPPDFFVVPDLVAAGNDSLDESSSWLHILRGRGFKLYLAVQDGMEPDGVVDIIDQHYDGIFVGGTTEWKEKTGATWTDMGACLDVPCHIGRCGTPKKIKWAHSIYATSIDSSLPLRCEAHLEKFVKAMKECRNEDSYDHRNRKER